MAAEVAPKEVQLDVMTIHGIPLYDADLEMAEGIPSAVETLKMAIAAADGLLIATPEYNGSMPGVFKNAVDWLSRPPADIPRVFRGKPVAITGASPGGFGTVLGQSAWLPVVRALGMEPWFGGRLMVSRANNAFDETGDLTDAGIRDQLRQFVSGFADFTRASA